MEPIVLGWGTEFARAVGDLVGSGDATASLDIVQEIEDLDDSLAKGIFLGPEVIAWLAIARASIDIDQYIYHDCVMD